MVYITLDPVALICPRVPIVDIDVDKHMLSGNMCIAHAGGKSRTNLVAGQFTGGFFFT